MKVQNLSPGRGYFRGHLPSGSCLTLRDPLQVRGRQGRLCRRGLGRRSSCCCKKGREEEEEEEEEGRAKEALERLRGRDDLGHGAEAAEEGGL